MKTNFCFQLNSDSHLWDTCVTRADSDSPDFKQGGSWGSKYTLLSGETQTFPSAGSSLSAQPLSLRSHVQRNREILFLLYLLLHLLLNWYRSSGLSSCWGLILSLHGTNSFSISDSMVFPYTHKSCPLFLEVSGIVFYLIPCHSLVYHELHLGVSPCVNVWLCTVLC